jgi:hypothetical protein
MEYLSALYNIDNKFNLNCALNSVDNIMKFNLKIVDYQVENYYGVTSRDASSLLFDDRLGTDLEFKRFHKECHEKKHSMLTQWLTQTDSLPYSNNN